MRNVVAQTAGRLVFLGSTLGVFIAVARVMGPEAFGQYSYVLTFVGLFVTLADFGTTTVLARGLAQHAERRSAPEFWGNFLLIRLAAALIAIPLAIGSAWWLKPDLLAYLVLVSLAIPLLAFRCFEPLFQVYEHPWFSVPPALVHAALYIGLSILAMALSHDILPMLVGYVVANAGYVVVSVVLARRLLVPRLFPRRDLARAIFTLALPLGISSIFTSLNARTGVFLLGAIASDYQVGIYNAAYRLLDLAVLAGILLMTPLIPIFSRLAERHRAQLRADYARLVELLGVVLLPGAILMPYVSPTVIRLCFGPSFTPAIPVLDVLAWSGVLIVFSLASSAVNVAIGQVWHGYWNGALATVTNVACSYFWVRRWGALGAAWGTLVAEAVLMVVSQVYTVRGIGGGFRRRAWLGVAVANAALLGCLVLVPLGLALRIGAGIVTYGAVVWLYGLGRARS